jgi:hypothetical protein
MASTRRLAAILAADVAGYSRLMGADEEGTLARLKAHRRDLVDPKIRDHHGRIVKTTGDGVLVEFPSVVDAVRCAAEVQRAMIDREAGMPEDRRIRFRVGINLGDVIVEDDDIFGDGVNIAARLEALSDPGGLCISRMVRDQIRDKLAYTFEDLGEQSVKNIARLPAGVGAIARLALDPLVQWVEHGIAPDQIIAYKVTGGVTAFTRPVRPYPELPRYSGVGDTTKASSFACVDDSDPDDNQPPAPMYLNYGGNYPIVPIDDSNQTHDKDSR